MGEALNHPLLRYRALLRGRGLFAAKVDLVQRGVEHVRRDVEFVGCVGAEPEDVGGQVGRELVIPAHNAPIRGSGCEHSMKHPVKPDTAKSPVQ